MAGIQERQQAGGFAMPRATPADMPSFTQPRPGARSVSTEVTELMSTATITQALIGEDVGRDGQTISATGEKEIQRKKAQILDEAARRVSRGDKTGSDDLDRIGRFVSQMLPQGSMGSTLDQDDIFGLGTSVVTGKRGGRNTVDTHEHYRIRREVRDLKKQALMIRMRKQQEEIEEYRQMRNKELIERNVQLQTLPLATS